MVVPYPQIRHRRKPQRYAASPHEASGRIIGVWVLWVRAGRVRWEWRTSEGLIPPPRECTRSVWSSAFRRPFERRSSSRVNAELQTGGGSKMRPAVVAPRRPMAAGVSSVPGSWSQQSDENEEDNWIHGEPLSLWHMHWDSEPMGDPPHPSSGHALPHWGVTV